MRNRGLVTAITALSFISPGCHYFNTESQIDSGLNHYEMGLYNQVSLLSSQPPMAERGGPPNPRLVEILLALGDMAQSEKRNDMAADFYPRALKAAEALKPVDNERLRNAFVRTGMFYSYHERAAEAYRCRACRSTVGGIRRSGVFAIDLDDLAFAHQNQKRYEKAVQLQSKALKIADKLPTAKYPNKGTILHNLGSSYMEWDDLRKLRPL